MMRGLVMDFPDDHHVYNIADTYMFGPSLLVKPITNPMYYTAEGPIENPDSEESIYLPKHSGKYWYDLNTQQLYTGGKTISYQTPLDVIPVFIKAGSILPINKVVQYVGEQKEKELELRIYSGADADFELYDKEGTFVEYPQRSFRVKLFIPVKNSTNYSVLEKLIRYDNKGIKVDITK